MLIGELFDILPKSKHSASYGKAEGRYPFFTSSNTVDSFVDEADYDGEYIIIGDGGTGNSKYIDGKFSVSDHNYILRPKGSTNAKAVDYFLKKDNYQILNAGFKGIGIKNVSKSYIESIDYKFCDRFSETFIVESLGRINEGIRLAKSELESLDSLIKSRFIEMFLSKSFETIKIRSLVDLNKQSAKKNYKLDEEFEYIDISSIDNKTNTIISSTRYALKDAPSRAQQCLKNNDILVSTVRPNLKNVALYQGNDYGYVGSSGFCVLRAKKCNPYYLMYNIISDDFTDSMVKLTTGASYPAIRDDDVLDYQIINAPLDLQNEFASLVAQIDKLKFTGVSWGVAIFEVGHRKQAGI